eukprot:CFRG6384T1
MQPLLTPSTADEQAATVQLAIDAQKCASECLERGLHRTSKWLCELAMSVELSDEASFEEVPKQSVLDNIATGSSHRSARDIVKHMADDRAFMLAKCMFNMREYSRAADALKNCNIDPSHVFLRRYSLYMDIAREAEDAADQTLKANPNKRSQGPQNVRVNSTASNKRAARLRELEAEMEDSEHLDGYQTWLYGCVLRDLSQKTQARELMVRAVHACPLLYTAWVDLVALIDRHEDLKSVVSFYNGSTVLEHHDTKVAIERYTVLHELFPNSSFIKLQLAVSYFNYRDMDEAQRLFEEVRRKEPHNLDRVDYYSHVLYVKKLVAELSHLARDVTKIDKYRPETCLVVGNYYSIRKDHQKAITYFQRALRLNCAFYSAWVLIGHEFMEMKNTQASIEAYRRAIAYNPREVRAWYGLGNAYELLQVFTFALYYYNKACTLRPNDGRMWMAVALVNEQLGNRNDAILAYRRGAEDPENQPDAYVSLAKVLIADNRIEEAADSYMTYINLLVEDDYTADQSFAEACLFLTKFYIMQDDYDKALVFTQRLLGLSGGPEKEEATILLRQINSLAST